MQHQPFRWARHPLHLERFVMYNFPHTQETTDGAVLMQEPAGPQVLIVDDDVSMQRMLRSRLEREGYHVVPASERDEGLGLIRKHLFNPVITDMRMPKVKGDELARSITQFNPDIPVIVMTAYGEVNEAVRVMHDGVSS